MHGEFLASGRRGSGKYKGLILSQLALQKCKYHLVVQVGVIVMHFYSVGPVIIHYSGHRYPLSKVRLKAVHAHVDQALQLILVPLAGLRIGEVHQSHSRLPSVALPHGAVQVLYKIPLLHALIKQGRLLADVAVDPHTDMKSSGLIPL